MDKITLAAKLVQERNELYPSYAHKLIDERGQYFKLHRIYDDTYMLFKNEDPDGDLKNVYKEELFVKRRIILRRRYEKCRGENIKTSEIRRWINEVLEFWKQKGFICNLCTVLEPFVDITIRLPKN